MRKVKVFQSILIAFLIILLVNNNGFSYSVLTHQAIIDTTWTTDFKPMLLKRFPGLTEEQLREARAYAYGGCIIQDMGYYPFSAGFFTDLTHYVRSGDFVENLISESQDVNEYAFALGALAHYAADNNGHPIATNQSVPIYYPKLKKKYGDVVTYVESPSAHLKAEFGFDVEQVAAGNYLPEAYHDFIGFKVAKPVLERAFFKTYGLEMKEVFSNLDLAISTYRFSVSKTIPFATKVAWETKKDEILKTSAGLTREKFVFRYTRKQYDKEFGNSYIKPTFSQKLVAFFIRIIPKIGPFRTFSFKPSTPETNRLFVESFKHTVTNYKQLLSDASEGRLNLENRDFDTGKLTHLGEYPLADKTYVKLLEKLEKDDFKNVTAQSREELLSFFADTNTPSEIKKDKDKWRKTLVRLEKLKAYQPPQ